jgi:hypothetical protein
MRTVLEPRHRRPPTERDPSCRPLLSSPLAASSRRRCIPRSLLGRPAPRERSRRRIAAAHDHDPDAAACSDVGANAVVVPRADASSRATAVRPGSGSDPLAGGAAPAAAPQRRVGTAGSRRPVCQRDASVLSQVWGDGGERAAPRNESGSRCPRRAAVQPSARDDVPRRARGLRRRAHGTPEECPVSSWAVTQPSRRSARRGVTAEPGHSRARSEPPVACPRRRLGTELVCSAARFRVGDDVDQKSLLTAPRCAAGVFRRGELGVRPSRRSPARLPDSVQGAQHANGTTHVTLGTDVSSRRCAGPVAGRFLSPAARRRGPSGRLQAGSPPLPRRVPPPGLGQVAGRAGAEVR